MRNRHPGFPRVTTPDNPVDPRYTGPRLETSPIKITEGHLVINGTGPSKFLPKTPNPWHPYDDLPMKPYDPYPWIKPMSPGKIEPFDPYPWVNPFVPFPNPDPEEHADLYKRIQEAFERQAKANKAQEGKEAMTKKVAELEAIIEAQQDVLALVLERLKAIEITVGLAQPIEPIIAEEIFALFNPLYYSSGDKEKANIDNTLAAIAFYKLTIEEWNELTPEDRSAKTISFLTILVSKGNN